MARFSFQHFLSDDGLQWLRDIDAVEPDDAAALALVYIRETGQIENAKLRDLADLETLEASRCLGRLCDAGLLEMQGSGSATYYVPGPEFPGTGGAASEENEERSQLELTGSERSTHKVAPGSHKQSHKESHKETGNGSGEDEFSRLLDRFPPAVSEQILDARASTEKKTLRKAIVSACRLESLSATELSELFDRERRYLMRAHVKPLIEAGRIARKFPGSPKHPKQRYYATNENLDDSSEE